MHLPAIRSANEDLLNSIFSPAAEALGQQLAAAIQNNNLVLEQVSAQEHENLRRQSERVFDQEKIEIANGPTRKQRKNLLYWIDAASEANPDRDQEEAAKWQAILAEILGKNNDATLKVLKQLTVYDVGAMRNIGQKDLSREEMERFAGLGLLERTTLADQLSPTHVPIMLILMACSFLLFGQPAMDVLYSDVRETVNNEFVRRLFIPMIGTNLAGGVVFLMYHRYRRAKKYVLTMLGEEIRAKIIQYLNYEDSSEERKSGNV